MTKLMLGNILKDQITACQNHGGTDAAEMLRDIIETADQMLSDEKICNMTNDTLDILHNCFQLGGETNMGVLISIEILAAKRIKAGFLSNDKVEEHIFELDGWGNFVQL